MMLLMLVGCGQKEAKKENTKSTSIGEEIITRTKEVTIKKQEPIIKKVSEDIYPEIKDLESSSLWQQDNEIIKSYQKLSKKFAIKPNWDEKELVRVSGKKDIPYGALIGNWASDSDAIKNIRINFTEDVNNPLLSEDQQSFLSIKFFAKNGMNYTGNYTLTPDSVSFNQSEGILIRINNTEDAIKITLQEGKLVIEKMNEFDITGFNKPAILSYQGIQNDGEEITDIDSVLTGVKQPIFESDVTIEKHKEGSLGYLLVYSRVLAVAEANQNEKMDFANNDILAYEINPDAQMAKFFQVDKEGTEKVTYIYKTPINNYEVVTAYGATDESEDEKEELIKVGISTSNVIPKKNSDSLFFENGMNDLFKTKNQNEAKKIDTLSDEELYASILNAFFEAEGISNSPFKKSLYGLSAKDRNNGNIVQTHLNQPQTHIVLTYTIDKEGVIHTDNESKMDNKEILSFGVPPEPVVTTTEEAMSLLSSREWDASVDEMKSIMTVNEEQLLIDRDQADDTRLRIEEIELVAPDHLVLRGKQIVSDVTYHVYFYQDGTIKLTSENPNIDLPSDEDKMLTLTSL